MAQKRKHSPDPSPDIAPTDDVFRSEPIDDRSSTFIGYYSPTLPAEELQRLEEFKSASHKILAWRKESNQRSIIGNKTQYDVGHDDDGEKDGGKRVEKVLEMMRVGGACVVARWYGGKMLGPVRFSHMEDCARGAVQKWLDHEAQEQVKRRKVVQDVADKEKLVQALADRDQSITVLRALAVEKEEKVKNEIVGGVRAMTSADGKAPEGLEDEKASKRRAPSALATPAVDYSAMVIERLRALDKARDATLSFLLKRIDKADADLKALSPASPPVFLPKHTSDAHNQQFRSYSIIETIQKPLGLVMALDGPQAVGARWSAGMKRRLGTANRRRTQQRPFRLLELPPELRTGICKFAVEIEGIIFINAVRTSPCFLRSFTKSTLQEYTEYRSKLVQPATTRVCRAIRAEALPHFYRANLFIAVMLKSSSSSLRYWLNAIGKSNVASLRRLYIAVRPDATFTFALASGYQLQDIEDWRDLEEIYRDQILKRSNFWSPRAPRRCILAKIQDQR